MELSFYSSKAGDVGNGIYSVLGAGVTSVACTNAN